MIDTQARGRVSNSAANSLPASENSAAVKLAQIAPKMLMSNQFSALRGCFLAAQRRFFPAGREMRRSPDSPAPSREWRIMRLVKHYDVLASRRADAGHAVGRIEPDPAEAAEQLGQGQPVRERQRRRQER